VSAQIPEDHPADQVDSMFGKPALLKGENKGHFMQLLAAVASDLNPKTSFDQMMVYDHANKYWEEARLRRISASLIESAKIEALEILLRPFCGDVTEIGERPADLARDYFCGQTNSRKNAHESVSVYGITPELIEAKAMQLVIGPLNIIDRMSGNRETSRRLLRKEHEQLRKERERVRAANDNAAARAADGAVKAEA
jgi:hypothetical protein